MGTTHLFTAGVLDNIINERTGRKSLDAFEMLWTYHPRVSEGCFHNAGSTGCQLNKCFENSFKQLGTEQEMPLNTPAKIPNLDFIL